MLKFNEWLAINELNEGKIPSFNSGEKLLKYVTENNYVALSVSYEDQPSEIKFLDYILKLEDGGVLGTHYWNRYNIKDGIEIDVYIDKRTRIPTIKIVTDPPMDADVWCFYDLKNGLQLGDYDRKNIKSDRNSKLVKKEFEELKKLLIKWNILVKK